MGSDSVFGEPDVIMNLTANDITTSSVLLNWTKPNGQSSRYRVEYENNNVVTENNSFEINDLTPGVHYTFRVFAVAADHVTKGRARASQISLYTSPSNTESNTWLIVGVVLAVICFLTIITLILFFYSRSNSGLRIEEYEEYFKRKHADSNYDSSRVKLSVCGSPFDDYINANCIPGYNSRKEFIAAQGPLPVTVNEFWRMVWEKNVYTIVMLTKCNEMGRVSFHCEILLVKTAESRYVRQFHFTAWPDHGVPQTTEVLIDFRHLVREHMEQYSRHSPTVVHCSAGVGRTGTFIAIDHLIFQIERDSIVDIYGIVNDMRMHRPLMVQTEIVFFLETESSLRPLPFSSSQRSVRKKQQGKGTKHSAMSQLTPTQILHASHLPSRDDSPVLFEHADQRPSADTSDMVSIDAIENELLDDSMFLIASDVEEMLGTIADPTPSWSAEPIDSKPGMDARIFPHPL
ncbi:hypothetical protein cypCar_00024369 [Cyprinus carpio]|nr:hypothetical protein cypCar_00024369 [Cyprinus carpio]